MIHALLLAAALAMGRAPSTRPQSVRPPPAKRATPVAEPPRPPTPAAAERELRADISGFQHDPLGYVLYAFPWGEGALADEKGPRKWQRKVLEQVGDHLSDGKTVYEAVKIAIASGHGIGKSALVAWLILWSPSTFEDTHGIVTANTRPQLVTKTWPELKKWHRLSINEHWFEVTATSIYSTDPKHSEWRIDAMPWTKENSEAFAGLHNKGKRVVLFFDEASAIEDVIWEVAEGALTDEHTEILWFAFGNPTRNTGRFRECFRKFRHRWVHHNIDSRTVEGTNKKQIQEWIDDRGIDSDFVKVRVRGIFPSQSFLQFIGEDLVDPAYGRHLRPSQYQWAPKIIAVEPAWTGADELVIGIRQGLAFRILKRLPKNDNDIAVGQMVARFQDDEHADAVFIDHGWGTGIYSYGKTIGREETWKLVPFGSSPADDGYLNKRAEMWGLMKQWLREGGAIPAEPQMREDLLGPEVEPRVDGKIQLESKEDMKARGIPSPNLGDCLALTFAHPVEPKTEEDRDRSGRSSEAEAEYDPLERGRAQRARMAEHEYDPTRRRGCAANDDVERRAPWAQPLAA